MKTKGTTSNQSGQVLVALVLVMLTILTIGLIVIQRSTTDIATSTQSDQASRAFSAAEAGIERALQSNATAPIATSLSNDAEYTVTPSAKLPLPRQAFEDFPLTRGEVSQVWLADLSNVALPAYYQRGEVYVYFGDANTDGTAIEITLLARNTSDGVYSAQRWFYDTLNRTSENGFTVCGQDSVSIMNPLPINTSLSTAGLTPTDRSFKCRVRISTFVSGNIVPVMIRARILYNDKQPFAVAPIPDGSPSGNDLPPQATIYTSIGLSGQSRKTIQVMKKDKTTPFFLDYAIFSTADIVKTN